MYVFFNESRLATFSQRNYPLSNSKTILAAPGRSVKLMSTMSFYLICRIYLQLIRLGLPSKLFYAFSLAFQLCFISIWAQIVLSHRNIFYIWCVSPFTTPPRSLGLIHTEPGGRQHDVKEECEALKPGAHGFRSWLCHSLGVDLGKVLSLSGASQSDETECSWHTGGPLGPCLPHS